MTIIFTDEEKKWLVRENLHPSIKEGCPTDIRQSLQRKIDLLNRQAEPDLVKKATRRYY